MSSEKRRIPEVDPEHEPEYVGAYGTTSEDRCQQWHGEYIGEVEQCDREATHTLVIRNPATGSLKEIASCDECGEPEDVDWMHPLNTRNGGVDSDE